jgi:hypothetical protein
VHRTNTYKSQNPPLQRVDQNQLNDMEKYTQNRLLDTVCLDQLLIKHLKQTGSVVDVDDISRLLDGKRSIILLEKENNLLLNSRQYSSQFNSSISNC